MPSSTRGCAMTELMTPTLAERPIAGRSLWGDAWARLKANRAAMVGPRLPRRSWRWCASLGPYFVPHQYTTIYPDYVRTPASSFAPYPQAEIRSQPRSPTSSADARRHQGVAPGRQPGLRHPHRLTSRSIERNTRYLDRSDTFDDAKVEELSPRTACETVMSAAIKQQYFLFGTDNTGRDLLVAHLDRRPHLAGHRPARRRRRRGHRRRSTAPLPAFSAARSTS